LLLSVLPFPEVITLLPEPLALHALRAVRAPHQKTGVTFTSQFEVLLDGPKPSDVLTYAHNRLTSALLWGESPKQLRTFALYLFGPQELQVAPKPLRHDPRLLLFSNPAR